MDIPRVAKMNVICSMQPSHATSDIILIGFYSQTPNNSNPQPSEMMTFAEDRLGKDRLEGAYAWHSMLKDGDTASVYTLN